MTPKRTRKPKLSIYVSGVQKDAEGRWRFEVDPPEYMGWAHRANGYSRQSSAEANRNNLVSGLRDSHPDAEIIVEDFA